MTLGQQVIYNDDWQLPDLRALRRDRIGFVFQTLYLIPFLDVTDNGRGKACFLLPPLEPDQGAVA